VIVQRDCRRLYGPRLKKTALLHGSELKTNLPFPEWTSRHSKAVGHPVAVHRIEDLARQLHLNSLSR
jgi:hypothetical protein